MEVLQDIQIKSLHDDKPILLDAYYEKEKGNDQPVVIFAHGFKGYKDWGHWHLIAQEFAKAGFVFIKFNFSHNGTTPENPTDFADLEAFGKNTFTKELDDFDCVIDWVQGDKNDLPDQLYDDGNLHLIGHSRGGGTAILKATEEDEVQKLVTWAAVSDFANHWDKESLADWKKEGVQYIHNSRTGQDMPLYYQLVEDYFSNLDRLHIPSAVRHLNKPYLIVHGTEDEAVSINEASLLEKTAPNARLVTIDGAGHTFGGYEPFDKDKLPEHSQTLVRESIQFLREEGG